MTSTVTAGLGGDAGPVELIEAIYPCGSITGAKIEAMEIIRALGPEPRGVYCGAIGGLAPDSQAAFNVAIRTLTLKAGATVARLGLGSGIVADGKAGDEWRNVWPRGRSWKAGSASTSSRRWCSIRRRRWPSSTAASTG